MSMSKDMKTQIILDIFKTLSPLIALLLIWIKIKLAQWLDSLITDQRIKNIMIKINSIITDVVKDVEQNYVRKEKAGSEAKLLTPETASNAKAIAMTKIKDQLGDKGMGEVQKALDITESKVVKLLSTKIEAKVFDLHAKTPSMLLACLFAFSMACTNVKPLAVTTTTIKTQENIVKAADEQVAGWYMNHHQKCLDSGIKIRDDLKIVAHAPDEEARTKGLIVYNNCIEEYSKRTQQIVEIIELIRAKDKVAAGVALAVARKEKPIEALGYVIPEVLDLVKQLGQLITEYGVK